jgi:amidase
MKLSEYGTYDALGLADLMRRKEVTVAELVTCATAGYGKVNPTLNAIIEMLPNWQQEARRAALDGPFGGVPFLIKDLMIRAQGVAQDCGSRLLAGAPVSPDDTDLMRRFRDSGVVLLGRTNVPEIGFCATTEPVLHGPTRNPWDTTRSPGGSSGGSAAAVAAGIVPIAHANDGGGSIRIPAGQCGAVGLKPTRGRIPVGPDSGDPLHGMGIEFAITRSVRDAAAMLDAVEGPGVGDRYVIPRPEHTYLSRMSARPRRLKLAFSHASGTFGKVDPACVAALMAVVSQCVSLRHTVEEAAPKYDEEGFHRASLTYWTSATAAALTRAAELLKRTPSQENLEHSVWANYQHGLRLRALDLEQADVAANQVCRSVGAFFREYDVLLTPVAASPAWPLRTIDSNDARHDAHSWYRQTFSMCPFTALYNLTGQPAISLPLAHTQAGLPVGIQLVGRYGDEGTLLSLAGQLEQAMPWKERVPPIHVSH